MIFRVLGILYEQNKKRHSILVNCVSSFYIYAICRSYKTKKSVDNATKWLHNMDERLEKGENV